MLIVVIFISFGCVWLFIMAYISLLSRKVKLNRFQSMGKIPVFWGPCMDFSLFKIFGWCHDLYSLQHSFLLGPNLSPANKIMRNLEIRSSRNHLELKANVKRHLVCLQMNIECDFTRIWQSWPGGLCRTSCSGCPHSSLCPRSLSAVTPYAPSSTWFSLWYWLGRSWGPTGTQAAY